MLRSVTLGIALSVLAAACALFSEPAPPGTIPVEGRFTNNTPRAIPLSMVLPNGEVARGAIQPISSVPAFSTVTVTVYVPLNGNWRLRFDDYGAIIPRDFPQIVRGTCRIVVVTNADGSGEVGCIDRGD